MVHPTPRCSTLKKQKCGAYFIYPIEASQGLTEINYGYSTLGIIWSTLPNGRKNSISNARAERIIVILLSLKLRISIEDTKTLSLICLPPNGDSTNI